MSPFLLQATVPIFPPDLVLESESTPVPWWVIFLAILAAVIILAVIVGVLWGVSALAMKEVKVSIVSGM